MLCFSVYCRHIYQTHLPALHHFQQFQHFHLVHLMYNVEILFLNFSLGLMINNIFSALFFPPYCTFFFFFLSSTFSFAINCIFYDCLYSIIGSSLAFNLSCPFCLSVCLFDIKKWHRTAPGKVQTTY